MLSGKDLMIAYSGNPDGTKLETALRGPMADMLPVEKRQVIFDWLHAGAKAEEIEAKITPILQDHCVACHNPEVNPHLPSFATPEGLTKVAAMDTGMTIPTLVRVSHIHLFSITFIFFIVGFIYTHAVVRPTWLKCVVLAVPFLSLITDVASWYLTKVWDGFAWMVIISGASWARHSPSCGSRRCGRCGLAKYRKSSAKKARFPACIASNCRNLHAKRAARSRPFCF